MKMNREMDEVTWNVTPVLQSPCFTISVLDSGTILSI